MRINYLKRREFVRLLGGTATAWAAPARAQQVAMPVIGFLNHGSPDGFADRLRAFRKGLSETGYVEGQNVAIEYRWANNQIDQLPNLASDLVHRRVAVIATPISSPASRAAKAATSNIPIVFGIGTDPIQVGLVTSINRPGGNITGVTGMNWELGPKRLGLLHELLPGAVRFAVLINPNTPEAGPFVKDVQAAAESIGSVIEVLTSSTSADIDAVFANLAERRVDALLVSTDQLFNNRLVQLVMQVTRHDVPAIYPWREAVEIGGLMSYASSLTDVFRQVGIYTGRILKGEKPADLPVMQATKFDFVINVQIRQNTRHQNSANVARPCRRGD
jgi:putative tryptophan/tyrosine transport system substrate-binding protein